MHHSACDWQTYSHNPSLVWVIWFWQLDKGMRGWQGKREGNRKRNKGVESCDDARCKWWPKSNMASDVRLGEQSRSEQVTNELTRSGWHIIPLTVCACLCVCKVDSMRERKSVCRTDKWCRPKGGLNLSLCSNTLPDIQRHTQTHIQRQISQTPMVSFISKEAWKEVHVFLSVPCESLLNEC